jgi:putative membrane protein
VAAGVCSYGASAGILVPVSAQKSSLDLPVTGPFIVSRMGSVVRRARIFAFAAGVAPALALAHANGRAADHHFWTAWNITPEIFIGTVIVAAIYGAGLWKQRRKQHAAASWPHVAFFSGLAAVFLALQSPLDALADRSFFLHQLQHLLLQTVGPMLLMLAAPQALLAAGLPAALRRRVLAPILATSPLRNVFGFLAHPWIAALLLVASLYAWHWPPYHDLAVLDDAVHYLMHFTMLAAGLVFFFAIFDPRPPPLGARYGTRINILWAAMTANVLLGASLALKDAALYSAYEQAGRLWDMGALEDEQLGALIMWIPGSVACVPAFFVLLRTWGSQEARIEARRARGIPSGIATTAANYRVALWLALAAFLGFAGTLGIGLIATGPRP